METRLKNRHERREVQRVPVIGGIGPRELPPGSRKGGRACWCFMSGFMARGGLKMSEDQASLVRNCRSVHDFILLEIIWHV